CVYDPPGGGPPLLQWSSPSMLAISPTHCRKVSSRVPRAGPCLGLQRAVRFSVLQATPISLHERLYEPAGPQSVLQPPLPGGCTMHWPGLASGGQAQFPFLSITVPGGHAAVAGLRPPSTSQSRTAAAREKNTRDDVIRIGIGRLPGMRERVEEQEWKAIRRGPSVATPLPGRVSPALKTPAGGNRSLPHGAMPRGRSCYSLFTDRSASRWP